MPVIKKLIFRKAFTKCHICCTIINVILIVLDTNMTT